MILDEILANKRLEVDARMVARPLSELEKAIRDAPPARGFAEALRAPGVSVIAEIKRRSPSGGELRPGASAADFAQLYVDGGATALSVLTDEKYFGGADSDLVEARAACSLPALRKDFLLDDYQLFESRAMGADCILLIVRSLDQRQLVSMLRLAKHLGLDALVEAHNADEVSRALDAGADMVGVNNRDLDRLVTDATLAPRLRSMVPTGVVFVAESGIHEPAQVAELAAVGADATLVGESLLRSPDPVAKLRELVAAGAPVGARP